MRDGRAIGRGRQQRRSGTSSAPTGSRLETALATVLVAFAGMASAPGLAATQAAVSQPSASQTRARAGQFDASKLADRVSPDFMGLQPIIVAQQSRFSVDDISGPPDEPLPLKISLPPENGDLFRVIMVRGLPANFKLTAGVSLDDAWALSPSEISRAALVAPGDYTGEFSMEVLFIRGSGDAREQEIVNVRIGAKPERADARSDREVSDTPEPEKPALAPEVEKSMFARAERLMGGGDIVGARLILRYLAEHGVAGAAFAMGQSYDPGFLRDIYVRGEDPSNIDKARDWYRRAAEMGNGDAASRLTAMQQDQ